MLCSFEESAELYEDILSIRTRDYFSSFDEKRAQFSNPAEMLIGGEEERFVRLCSDESGLPFEKMSDYERFAAFVNNRLCFSGSGVAEVFAEKVRLFTEEDIDSYYISPQALWTLCCEKMSFAENGLDTLGAEKGKSIRLPRLCGCVSYTELLERNFEALDGADEETAVIADISDVEFLRSDKFHCEEAFSAFFEDGVSGRDMLVSGLLYSLCEKMKKRNIRLWLNIGGNYSFAEKLIKYFSGRGVLPSIRVFASGDCIVRAARGLCGEYPSGSSRVKVLCGVLYECGDTSDLIADKIKKIAAVYPLKLLRFGGTDTNEPLFAAHHRVFAKGLYLALHDICGDCGEALGIARAVLEN